MAIAGRVVLVLGVAALLLAGYLVLMELGCSPGAGFELCLDQIVYTASAVIAVIGALGVGIGRHMIREAREQREFNEAMEQANRSKKD